MGEKTKACLQIPFAENKKMQTELQTETKRTQI